MDRIAQLLADKPLFHAGGTRTYGLSEDALREINRHLAPEHVTLETGCGMSTLLFATANTRHFCVTPNQCEADVAVDYCKKNGIALDRLKLCIGSSAELLPKMVKDGPLDVVLIDGAHSLPFPMVDFHYTESRLRVGGILVVDDCQIPAVRVLADFLSQANEWSKLCHVGNTTFFRRTAETNRAAGWDAQPWNSILQSLPPGSYGERATRKLRRLMGRFFVA